jgi:hypothetical protein
LLLLLLLFLKVVVVIVVCSVATLSLARREQSRNPNAFSSSPPFWVVEFSFRVHRLRKEATQLCAVRTTTTT